MLVAVLFAQGTLAAHGCAAPASSAVQGMAAEAMPCHEAEQHNANACLMHCAQADQMSLDHQNIVAVSFDEVVLHVSQPQPLLQHKVSAIEHSSLVLDTGPPLSIRFCSFLI